MNRISCYKCSQSVSPKKKLSCLSKHCSAICHIKCDHEILNNAVAKTIESYFCPGCREGGSKIVYKQHGTRSRSKSPLETHIPGSNSDVDNISPGNVQGRSRNVSTDKKLNKMSSNENTPMRNMLSIPLKCGEDLNLVGENPQGSLNLTAPCHTSSPTRSQSVPPGEKTVDILNKTCTPTLHINDASTTKNDHSEVPEKDSNSKPQLTQTQIKEMEDELAQHKEILIGKKAEINRLESTVRMKNEQIKLLNQSLSIEVEEKFKYKAKLSIREGYVKKLENRLDEINVPSILTSTSATQTNKAYENEVMANNTMLRHDIKLKDEHIINLNYDIDELRNKNNHLKNRLHTVEYESMRRMSSNKREVQEKEMENKERQIQQAAETINNQKLIIEKLHNKLQDIGNILYETNDYQKLPEHQLRPESNPGRRDPTNTPERQLRPESNSGRRDPTNTPTKSTANSSLQNSQLRYRRSQSPPTSRLSSISSNTSRHESLHQSPPSLYRTRSNAEMSSKHHSPRTQRDDDDEKEAELIKKKKKNLIILGMPEMNSNKDALKEFIEMNDFLGNHKLEKWDIRSIGRIGDRSDDRPRPLKVELRHFSDKLDIMRRLYRLQNYRRYEGIIVQHDLTPNQLKHYAELKDEAKRLERQQSNSNSYFRVRGPPGKWKIVQISKN